MANPEKQVGEIEEALASTRAELASTLGQLRGAVGQTLDWRGVARRHPWPTVLVCALIGLRLGRGRWL